MDRIENVLCSSMSRMENGVYIIQGEVNLLVTAMRRNSRWLTSHNHQVFYVHVIVLLPHGVGAQLYRLSTVDAHTDVLKPIHGKII